MAICELVLQQSYLGKDIYNVFHYLNLTNTGFGQAWVQNLVEQFEAVILPAINGVQVDGVSNVSIRAFQVENVNIQYNKAVSGTGALDVDPLFFLPAAQTFAFRLQVSQSYNASTGDVYVGNRRITNGYKRFAGVSDGLISGGAWLSTFAEGTEVDALEEALFETLDITVPSAADAEPIVYGRPIPATLDLPARGALFAYVDSAQLVPPRWTRRRQ